MKNLSWRINISSAAFNIHRIGTRCWSLVGYFFLSLASVAITYSRWTARRRLKKLTNRAAGFHERADSIRQRLKTFHQLPERGKKELLSARTALLEEAKHLRVSVTELTSYRAPGAALFVPILTHVCVKLKRRQRQLDSFKKLISRIDSDTFYLDLLLWLVIPNSFSEELLGDLNEEYGLLQSTDGEVKAKAWYRDQVVKTLKDCLWEKIVRLAALGTLIDLLYRWLRK